MRPGSDSIGDDRIFAFAELEERLSSRRLRDDLWEMTPTRRKTGEARRIVVASVLAVAPFTIPWPKWHDIGQGR
jgi:alpha-D-ribose 1-methylphosphonate 5-triphosphate synthase subunit PhnL